MHFGLRDSYYQAMISTAIGIMVLTAYVTTRIDLAPLIQAPFDIIIVLFSSITVIGGLINRSHCIRLNQDVKECTYEKSSITLKKQSDITTQYYAEFDSPIGRDNLKFKTIQLIPKKELKSLFDGRNIEAEALLDVDNGSPIAIHFEENFIFAKLSLMAAIPQPVAPPKKILRKRISFIAGVVVITLLILAFFKNDLMFYQTKLEFTQAKTKPEDVKEKVANKLITAAGVFPQSDPRQFTSKITASRYFCDTNKVDRAINELELAVIQADHMEESRAWKSYVLVTLGRVLTEAERYDEAEERLQKCLNLLNIKKKKDLLVPILGWWQYKIIDTATLKEKAYIDLAIAHDITHDDKKAENAYKNLISIDLENKNLLGAELGRLRLASFYRRRGLSEKAEEQYYKTIQLAEKETVDDQSKLAQRLVELGIWAFGKNEIQAAEFLFKQALPINEKSTEFNKIQLAINLNFLGETLKIEKKYDEAKPLFERSLEILSKEKTNAEWTWPELSLTDIKIVKGKSEDSLAKIEKIHKIRLQVFGEGNVRSACPLHSKAKYYQANNQWEKALPLYREVLTKRRSILGKHHAQVIDVMNDYILALKKTGDEEQANKQLETLGKLKERPAF